MKVLPTLLSVVFVAIYVAGGIVFTYFLGIIDYGGLPSNSGLWASMIAAGTLAGVLALGVESTIYRWRGIWPAPAFWFILRMILFAAAWLSLAYLFTTLLATIQQLPDPRIEPAAVLDYVAGAAVVFLYMLPPAGLICPFVGLASGGLLLAANRHSHLHRPALVQGQE